MGISASSTCDRSFVFKIVVLCGISCYFAPRYIESIAIWLSKYILSCLQRRNRWSLGMDKYIHPACYNACNYLFLLGININHVSKMSQLVHRLWKTWSDWALFQELGTYGPIHVNILHMYVVWLLLYILWVLFLYHFRCLHMRTEEYNPSLPSTFFIVNPL